MSGRPPSPAPRLGALWAAVFALPAASCVVGTALALVKRGPTRTVLVLMSCAAVVVMANVGMLAFGPTRRWLARRRKHLTALAVAVLLGLCVAEVALRKLYSPPRCSLEGSIFERDDEIGFVLRPGSSCRQRLEGVFDAVYTVNSHGTRGAEWREARPGRRTILALGCSQTFGHGVQDDESWPARLEAELGDEARVINGGVPAYGVQQMWLLGRRLADACAPDVIVVGVAPLHLPRSGHHDYCNNVIGSFGLRVPVLGLVDGAPRVVRMVPETVAERDEVTVLTGGAIQAERPDGWMVPRLARAIARRVMFRVETALDGDAATLPVDPPARECFELSLRGLADVAKSKGAQLLVMVLPSPDERGTRENAAFRAMLEAIAAREPFELWDATEEVMERLDGRRLRLHPFVEPHFSPEGHAAIAGAVRAKLVASSVGAAAPK